MKDALSILIVFALEAVGICFDVGVEVLDERDAEELMPKARVDFAIQLQDVKAKEMKLTFALEVLVDMRVEVEVQI